jgi:hypothetical protein
MVDDDRVYVVEINHETAWSTGPTFSGVIGASQALALKVTPNP